MKPRQWEWSNKNEEDYKPVFKTVAEGEQYLHIDKVSFDEDTKNYVFEMTSLAETGGSFKIFQKLLKNDGTTNYFGLKWLNAIGYACSGFHTVLQADEMTGCVILATITLEPSFKEKEQYMKDMAERGVSSIRTYPTIDAESIEPVSSEMKDWSDHVDENGVKDQFFYDEE